MGFFKVKLPPKGKALQLNEVAKGLWTIDDAYADDYDFFELSTIYGKPQKSRAKRTQAKGEPPTPVLHGPARSQ